MRSFLFPDVNVWLALTASLHSHHRTAVLWLESQRDARLYFCRFTQISLLRLLTTAQIMGEEVMRQRDAWAAYRRWRRDDRIGFYAEPEGPELEQQFRALSSGPHSSPKLWADSYVAAFASVAGLTLVTFDRALGTLAPGPSLLLE